MDLERARASVFLLDRKSKNTAEARTPVDTVHRASTADLLEKLRGIKAGEDGASAFQQLVSEIMEIVFHPHLRRRVLEHKLNDGRKRVDIVFTNVAEKGFFDTLQGKRGVLRNYLKTMKAA